MFKLARLKLAAVLWLAGMAGVVALSLTVLPQLLQKSPPPVSSQVVIAASLLQSAALLALAVWAGVELSRPVGLHAPVAEAAVADTGVWSACKPQILPATAVGFLVGGLLAAMTSLAPQELKQLGAALQIPLFAKLLYGGITEEILMRWGLMTTIVWLLWRLLQKGSCPPQNSIVIAAIVLAAIFFGLGHLPLASGMGVELRSSAALFIVAGNALPGILFGWLYWRWGLEAAILAHALSHATANLGWFPVQ